MSVIRTCCNKELVTSCIYGCDNRYCTNTETVMFFPICMSCSGYVNRDVFSAKLKEEVCGRDGQKSSGTY
jgi:hypothetical protein